MKKKYLDLLYRQKEIQKRTEKFFKLLMDELVVYIHKQDTGDLTPDDLDSKMREKANELNVKWLKYCETTHGLIEEEAKKIFLVEVELIIDQVRTKLFHTT